MALVVLSSLLLESSLLAGAEQLVHFGKQPNKTEYAGRTDVFLENFFSWHEPTARLNYELLSPAPFGDNLVQQPPDRPAAQLNTGNPLITSDKFTTSDLNLSDNSPSSVDFGSSSNDPFNVSDDAVYTATNALTSSPLTAGFVNLTGQLIGSTANLITNLTANLTTRPDNQTVELDDESSVNTLYDVPVHLIVLLALAYGLVSLTAVIGNSIVLWFVVRSRKLRTVTNIFIANLAIADILIGALAIPFQFQVSFGRQASTMTSL